MHAFLFLAVFGQDYQPPVNPVVGQLYRIQLTKAGNPNPRAHLQVPAGQLALVECSVPYFFSRDDPGLPYAISRERTRLEVIARCIKGGDGRLAKYTCIISKVWHGGPRGHILYAGGMKPPPVPERKLVYDREKLLQAIMERRTLETLEARQRKAGNTLVEQTWKAIK